MNLSKKTIKHILRILNNKCVEVPTKMAAFAAGGHRVTTRDFEPKCQNGWNRIVYVESEGFFVGIRQVITISKLVIDFDIPEIKSPAQLADL